MSIASEITRLQNAKANLKTAINSKNDNEHQITNETIDDYSTFVNDIQTGGNLQSKTVTLTGDGTTTITPDDGYDGLSSVVVNVEIAYMPLDYLYSPTNAFLATDIIPASNIEIEMKFTSSGYNNKSLFGTSQGYRYYHLTLYNLAYYWGINNEEDHGGRFSASVTTPHTVIFNNNGRVIVDNTDIGNCLGTMSTTKLNLFQRENGNWLEGRVYYVIIRDTSTNTILMDLHPKLRMTDNVVGFYDTISENFYTSNGSANFTT